ncbi:hypothetical protein B7Z28_02090 [Candidatus Saccharibacteria bacterium 32-45-3]|nr:MAG: hypothetical protein B7Z28_02090 [Candidatus Saccharibacteria bacterium 32-45-3]
MGFTNIKTLSELVLVFVGLVVLPPIFEEIIFRGYLYGRVRLWWRFVPTALLTSVMFGVVHGQWNVGIDVFILSLVMCYVREKFDSIWPSIIMHMLKNGLAYFLLFIGPLIGISI